MFTTWQDGLTFTVPGTESRYVVLSVGVYEHTIEGPVPAVRALNLSRRTIGIWTMAELTTFGKVVT